MSFGDVKMSVFQSCSFVTLALVVAVGWAAHVSKCDVEKKQSHMKDQFRLCSAAGPKQSVPGSGEISSV